MKILTKLKSLLKERENYSQLNQDTWVLEMLDYKKHGVFVEVGAADGITFSNTKLLEADYGWQGLCIEANPLLFRELQKNRKCLLSSELISSSERDIFTFNLAGLFSGILDENSYELASEATDTISLCSTTLTHVLQEHAMPSIIDYLSIDVEGHDYEVLKGIDFSQYSFRCITIEHNEPQMRSEYRKRIRQYLEERGYTFVKGNDYVPSWRHGPIDDFYCHTELIPSAGIDKNS